MASDQWFILSYVLPSEPSRKRVLVWRHLRKLGAIYLDTGIWFLPNLPALRPRIDSILAEITELGGRCHSFIASGTDEADGEQLRDIYVSARRDEYSDLLEKCERYLRHAERVIEAGDFQFVEVEELEEDLEKRKRWLKQIVERDAFGMDERRTVEACLKRCEDELNRFVEAAYLAGTASRTETHGR
ncbi:MAG TPA: Chromate resistance protein ChrB [Dehalococcoidia bacterium]|nr:Chromate resistance protein ChrB [Dehalococcoidia bacterium]